MTPRCLNSGSSFLAITAAQLLVLAGRGKSLVKGPETGLAELAGAPWVEGGPVRGMEPVSQVWSLS